MYLVTEFSSQVYLISYCNSFYFYFNTGLAYDNRHILYNHEEI